MSLFSALCFDHSPIAISYEMIPFLSFFCGYLPSLVDQISLCSFALSLDS